MTPADLILHSTTIILVLLIAALLLTTMRVMLGPSLADRVLALDMLVAIAIGFIAVIAIRTGHDLYVDIALALGLVGFLATVAFARFIASGAEGQPLRALPNVETVKLKQKAKPAKQKGKPS